MHVSSNKRSSSRRPPSRECFRDQPVASGFSVEVFAKVGMRERDQRLCPFEPDLRFVRFLTELDARGVSPEG
jgi:hypothetical protein